MKAGVDQNGKTIFSPTVLFYFNCDNRTANVVAGSGVAKGLAVDGDALVRAVKVDDYKKFIYGKNAFPKILSALEQTGGYVYDVNTTPKTEVAKLTDITIRKVWNTDKSTEAAKSITVQLLRNGNVIKTAILSEENHWQVTYSDLPASDAYSIKEVDVPKGFTATYKQNGYVFTVTNTSTLIQTGQLTWPIPVLAVSGMLLIAIGITLLQKKGKSNA
jgi:hypothetical protein